MVYAEAVASDDGKNERYDRFCGSRQEWIKHSIFYNDVKAYRKEKSREWETKELREKEKGWKGERMRTKSGMREKYNNLKKEVVRESYRKDKSREREKKESWEK